MRFGTRRPGAAAHLIENAADSVIGPKGRPTRMKKRTKACEKCSRKGDFSRHRGPSRFA